MKKFFSFSLTTVMALMVICSSTTSCKKNNNSGPGSTDSGTFYFHLHTQITDSTIGGNTDGYDSNTTGSHNPWYLDGAGRRIELFVPQFFISNVKLVNANGTIFTTSNVAILKGLDSEDYYICKAPIGTYVSATFTVGLANADSTTPPSTLFLTDGIPYPSEWSMWNGTSYWGMKITGAYDPVAGDTSMNPTGTIPFNLEIPNSLTIQHPVTLPTRGQGTYSTYPVYVLTRGGIQYIHLLCDYGKLLATINLSTSNQTSSNPLIADSLANGINSMFRYEQ